MTRWLAFERRWCAELCGAIVPIACDDPRGHPFSETRDQLLDAAPARFRVATRLAVWVVMLSPVFVQHRLRTLTALDEEDRDAVLRQTLTSRHALVRDLTGALQLVACICVVRGMEPPPGRAPEVPR